MLGVVLCFVFFLYVWMLFLFSIVEALFGCVWCVCVCVVGVLYHFAFLVACLCLFEVWGCVLGVFGLAVFVVLCAGLFGLLCVCVCVLLVCCAVLCVCCMFGWLVVHACDMC